MNAVTPGSRVLVTGAAGIIGRATVARLQRDGYHVAALLRDPAQRSLIQGVLAGDAVAGDAGDPRTVANAMRGCDAVVHLAALAHPSLGTPREVFANNTVSTFTVLSEAAQRGVTRIVLASSIQANGLGLNPHQPLPRYFPLDEDHPCDLADPYSLSKRTDELSAGMAARAWGLEVAALRFPLVKDRTELRRIQAEMLADPASMMRTAWAYLTDRDAARAVAAALRANLAGATVFGLSADDTLLPVPTAQLLATYAPTVPVTRALGEYECLVDTSRAQSLLGFRAAESISRPASAASAGM